MPDTRQTRKPQKKSARKKDTVREGTEALSRDQDRRIAALDDFIEGVLEEAGEDFLDQFKQIEGE